MGGLSRPMVPSSLRSSRRRQYVEGAANCAQRHNRETVGALDSSDQITDGARYKNDIGYRIAPHYSEPFPVPRQA